MGRAVFGACVLGMGLCGAIGVTGRLVVAGEVAAPGEERITAEGLRRQLMFLASPELGFSARLPPWRRGDQCRLDDGSREV